MNVLAINTSSFRLGVALLSDGNIIGIHETYVKKNQSTRAMPAIEQLMKDAQMEPENLDRIVVAEGPGSFTGIRIGVTIAKTLAWALHIPIVGVSTLHALAFQASLIDPSALIVPFFDARRSRVYTGAYAWKNGALELVIEDKNIDMNAWIAELKALNKQIIFLSPDLDTYKTDLISAFGNKATIPGMNHHRVDPVHVALAGETASEQNVHTFVPKYLRLAEAEKKWQEEQEGVRNE